MRLRFAVSGHAPPKEQGAEKAPTTQPNTPAGEIAETAETTNSDPKIQAATGS
jgi:hypothetical protein